MPDYLRLLTTCYRLKRFQTLEMEAIKQYQMVRFKTLVHQAYARVPMYREFYKACHFHPSSLSTHYEDMERVPVISKNVIRSFPLSKRVDPRWTGKNILKETTSGSTGKPIEIWNNRTQGLIQTLKCIRFLYAWGYSMFDNTIQLWGDIRHPKTSPVQKIGLFNRRLFSIKDDMSKNLIALGKTRCDVLSSTRSSLESLADALETAEIDLKPKLLVSEGEIITDEHRRRFQAVFGCKTIEIYGCAETGNIAWECPEKGNLHTDMETVAVNYDNVEINSAGQKTGAVVVTNLENNVMPFIRYNLGDSIVLPENTRCGCGRTLEVLGRVQGRDEDVISYKGEKYSWHYFYSYFKDYSYIRQYRIIQATSGRIRFVIQLFDNTKAQRQYCRRHLISVFDHVFSDLEICFTNRFPTTPGKKMKVIERYKPVTNEIQNKLEIE